MNNESHEVGDASSSKPQNLLGPLIAIVAVVFVVLTIAFGFASPTKPPLDTFRADADQALKDGQASNLDASGAPQQQVVNGWTERDLTRVQISQNNEELHQLHVLATMLFAFGVVVVTLLIRIWLSSEARTATSHSAP